MCISNIKKNIFEGREKEGERDRERGEREKGREMKRERESECMGRERVKEIERGTNE